MTHVKKKLVLYYGTESVRKVKLDTRDCIHVRFLESRYIYKYQGPHNTFYPMYPLMNIYPLICAWDFNRPGETLTCKLHTGTDP